MPRKSKTKTLSGQEAGPARPAVGVPYGEGERRLEAQRRTPVPVAKGQNLPVAPNVGGGGGAPQAAPTDTYGTALAAAQAMAPPGPGLMDMPTARPNETLMTGSGAPAPSFDDGLFELRELVKNFTYPDLQDMLSVLQSLNRAESEM